MTDPVLVEVLRGDRVESRHAGAVAVLDPEGKVVFAAGDIDAPVYPRSAVKALQALPLIESGAADRFGLAEAEIALACASHGGEPAHVETATAMLAKAGRTPSCLECGVQWPSDARAVAGARGARARRRARSTTTARASIPASSASPARWARTRRAT